MVTVAGLVRGQFPNQAVDVLEVPHPEAGNVGPAALSNRASGRINSRRHDALRGNRRDERTLRIYDAASG
jgi:hypothetical protein